MSAYSIQFQVSCDLEVFKEVCRNTLVDTIEFLNAQEIGNSFLYKQKFRVFAFNWPATATVSFDGKTVVVSVKNFGIGPIQKYNCEQVAYQIRDKIQNNFQHQGVRLNK